MQMNVTHNLYILGAAALTLASCHDDETLSPSFTVGEADNAIVLSAGVADRLADHGGQTRASSETNHSLHTPFDKGTRLALRVSGEWWHSQTNKEDIAKLTTATIGDIDANTDEKHNKVTFSATEQLYWDDYGMADPFNRATGRGRDKGLTIYGAAVSDKTKSAPTFTETEWTGTKTWTLRTSQDQAGWIDQDLLTSNNIQPIPASPATVPYSTDGNYRFDDRAQGKLLEFTHAMSKVTVVLTAGKGFPGYEDGLENATFDEELSVTLSQFYNTGNVSVANKTSVPTTTSKVDINMHLEEGGLQEHTATFDALVFPGIAFADDTKILTLNADDNHYNVTAKKLNDAIRAAIDDNDVPYPATEDDDLTFKQGWNYVIRITVHKTEIHVTATIADWQTVSADPVEPKIDIDFVYGHPDTDDDCNPFTEAFDLYRSTAIDGSYLADGNHSEVVYSAENGYTLTPQLYWPNHNTHYFFRGVWPKVGSLDSENEPLGPSSTQIKTNTIDLANEAYHKGYYPSDLMIARPMKAGDTEPDETCKVAAHGTGTDAKAGICATEGKIHLNFHYVMSQVEVLLQSTSNTSDPNYVNVGANTVVELVNVSTSGVVRLSDREVVPSTSTTNYVIPAISTDGLSVSTTPTLADAQCTRHAAIVPQALTYSEPGAASNLRFRVTVTNTDETTDVYYADVAPIKKTSSTDLIAPNGKWESGYHYKYVLTLKKTGVSVTATLKDWVTVTADENVWF